MTTDERFDRIENILERMEKRFDQVDHRFDQVDQRMDRMDVSIQSLYGRMDNLQQYVEGMRTEMPTRVQHLEGSFDFLKNIAAEMGTARNLMERAALDISSHRIQTSAQLWEQKDSIPGSGEAAGEIGRGIRQAE